MRSPNAVILAMVALFAVVQLTACSARSGPPDPQVRNQVFLDFLPDRLRHQFGDSALIDEGHKVCDAQAQGQSWDQLEQLVAKDLKLVPESDEVAQFVSGTIDGGLC